MQSDYQSLYPAHVEEMQRRWETSLAVEKYDAAVVHSGTPMYGFQDDYEYAFRPNPNFLAWLPLTHHPDSVLIIVPGEKPRLCPGFFVSGPMSDCRNILAPCPSFPK